MTRDRALGEVVRTGKDCFKATRRLRAALLTSTALVVAASLMAGTGPARAQDATWLANPGTAELTAGSNWSSGSVPTGTAFFDTSATTALTLNNTATFGGWTFNAGASAYTFNTSAFLQFNGAGIAVNGGSVTINNIDLLTFSGSSTAGSATITTSNELDFFDTSRAGTATITNNYILYFNASSSADHATITNNRTLNFDGNATASNATITNNGNLNFNGRSTAGLATLTNNSGGTVDFSNTTGPNGDNKVTAGSIAGAGNYVLGANELTVGSNNLSTEVSGVISGTGSLVKVGTGTLILSGANTYTGGTTVDGVGSELWLGNLNGGVGSILGSVTVGNSLFKIVNADTSGITTITNGGYTTFYNSTTAGTANITNNNTILFTHNSSADHATITNNGLLNFVVSSSAGDAVITNNDQLNFSNSATAGSATINNGNNSYLNFLNNSTAGSATFTNNSYIYFKDTTSAGNATIDNTNGTTFFYNNSTGSNATITNNAGGGTLFYANSTAGNAQLINNAADAVFDFSYGTGPNGDNKLSAGSIAGGGMFSLGANTLTVGSNDLTTTVSGAITDGGANGGTGGALVKTGTGTLTLTGTNTYTGGTTFAGGTVSVSSDANLGDAAGGLTFDGGALRINGTAYSSTARAITLGTGGGTFNIADPSNTFMLSQVLTGTGGLTKAGDGTLTLSGTNTYTGATTINRGNLTIAGSIASSTITNNNATLWYVNSATAGSATITNSGSVVFFDTSSAGSASITNNNQLTFYGNTTAGSATITNTGTVLFDGNSTAGSAQLINSGSSAVVNFFTPGPAGNGQITAGSIAGGGRFDLNEIELTVGGNNLSTEVTGVLTGDGITTGTSLIKTGTGTLTLSGINTYTGATIVDGGVLSVNGSIAASSGVTVNNGGTLGGGGTVGTTTVNAGGTLAAGNGSPNSSLNVAGSLALQSGAFYVVQVNPTTSSFANVTGTATLGGSTLQAVYADGSYVAKQYTILTAGSVNGTFGSVVQTNLPSNFRTTLSYDATHAYLNLILTFVAPPGSGLSGNQQKVGDAIINSFNANGGISLVYSGLTATGLTQVSGETATGSQQIAMGATTQFLGSMTDVFAAGRGGTAPGAMGFADEGNASADTSTAKSRAARDAFAMFTKAPLAQGYDPRWSVWASGFGGSQTTDGNSAAGSNTSTSRIYGVAVGADYLISPATVAGFAMAGGGTNFSVIGGGSGRSDLFQIGGFVRHTIGSTYLSGALAYGWQDVTTNRNVMTDQLQAHFNTKTFSGRFEAGNRTVTSWFGGLGLTPYAAAQVTAIALPAYVETALSGSNAFALSYAGKTVTDTRSELGLRTDKSFAVNDAILTLRGRAAWAHDFNPDRSVAATFQALPGVSFVVNGAAAARDAALTTASAEIAFISGLSLAATFEGEFSDVTRSYAGKGTVRYQW